MKPAELAAIARAIAPRLKQIEYQATSAIADLRARVEQLEARRPLQYCGVFDDGGEYAENDLVTFDGSLWICLRETKARPGSDDSWQLCVKRGRDGRDAR